MSRTSCPCGTATSINRIGASFASRPTPIVPPTQPVTWPLTIAFDSAHFVNAGTGITIVDAGTYYITYTLSINDPATTVGSVDIQVNAVPVSGMSFAGKAIVADSTVVTVTAGSTVSIVIHTPTPFTLFGASLTLLKIK